MYGADCCTPKFVGIGCSSVGEDVVVAFAPFGNVGKLKLLKFGESATLDPKDEGNAGETDKLPYKLVLLWAGALIGTGIDCTFWNELGAADDAEPGYPGCDEKEEVVAGALANCNGIDEFTAGACNGAKSSQTGCPILGGILIVCDMH